MFYSSVSIVLLIFLFPIRKQEKGKKKLPVKDRQFKFN